MNAPRYITTPAGVRIGCAYQPPPARMQGDAVFVQAALLDQRTTEPQTWLQRLLGAVWRWL